MRHYITIGVTKAGAIEILHGPEKGYGEHREEFQKLGAGKKKETDGKYAEVRVVDISRGTVKTRRFSAVKLKGADAREKSTTLRTVGEKKAAAPKPARKSSTKAKAPASKSASEKPAPAPSKAPATADEGTFPEDPKL